tara:strand:+ start:643 stop:1236 length:594 start_codon:yes stop_codon:yes gene_type:complete
MLVPTAREWDEYFSMCSLGQVNGEICAARLKKLRQCKNGVVNVPEPERKTLKRFLLDNQLSPLHEIAMFTGIGPDRIKEVFFENRDTFFVFRTAAKGDDTVYYSALENPIPERPLKKAALLRRMMIVRWMSYRGFVEPYYCHQPLGMSVSQTSAHLRDMGYRHETVEFGDGNRSVFFDNSRKYEDERRTSNQAKHID